MNCSKKYLILSIANAALLAAGYYIYKGNSEVNKENRRLYELGYDYRNFYILVNGALQNDRPQEADND